MVNFGPPAAEIGLPVWSTPANFNGFRVSAALLHDTLASTKLCSVEQRAPPGRPSRWALTHILGFSNNRLKSNIAFVGLKIPV